MPIDKLTQDEPKAVTHKEPIKSLPGSLSVKQCVGRDALAKQCWGILREQSLRLENERRIGKTLLMDKMIEMKPYGFRCIKMEIGGVSSAADFVNAVLAQVEKAVPEHAGSIQTMFQKTVNALAGVEVGGILRLPPAAQQHWREILMATLSHALSNTEDVLVFFWDEMPWMLENIADSEGGYAAVDRVLGTLRDIRHEDEFRNRIRMVYTGSIGFHHLEDRLAKLKLANGQNNDMVRIEVPPLDKEATHEFVHRAAAGEAVVTSDLPGMTEVLFYGTGGMAFYIHYLVGDLAKLEVATSDDIPRLIDERLRDPYDHWKMRHYRDRITKHYGHNERAVLSVLDSLAIAAKPVHFDMLYEPVVAVAQASLGVLDKSDMVKLLQLMALDHYIAEGPTRHYAFKFPIIKQWWYLDRGLDL